MLLSIRVHVDGFIFLVYTTLFSILSNLNWLKILHLLIMYFGLEYAAVKSLGSKSLKEFLIGLYNRITVSLPHRQLLWKKEI